MMNSRAAFACSPSTLNFERASVSRTLAERAGVPIRSPEAAGVCRTFDEAKVKLDESLNVHTTMLEKYDPSAGA